MLATGSRLGYYPVLRLQSIPPCAKRRGALEKTVPTFPFSKWGRAHTRRQRVHSQQNYRTLWMKHAPPRRENYEFETHQMAQCQIAKHFRQHGMLSRLLHLDAFAEVLGFASRRPFSWSYETRLWRPLPQGGSMWDLRARSFWTSLEGSKHSWLITIKTRGRKQGCHWTPFVTNGSSPDEFVFCKHRCAPRILPSTRPFRKRKGEWKYMTNGNAFADACCMLSTDVR